MKTLKEKFGQFALTREQMKMVTGGQYCFTSTYHGNTTEVCRTTSSTCGSVRDAAIANGASVTACAEL